MKLELEPIGTVRSPYKNRYEAPRQGGEEVSEIVVFEEYEGELKDIEGFSHLHIFYYACIEGRLKLWFLADMDMAVRALI